MPQSSEAKGYLDIKLPLKRKPQPEVVKEATPEISLKIQKKIAKKIAACISAGIVASSGGFITLGETGHLPEQVQEWYDELAINIRMAFGIEDIKNDTNDTKVIIKKTTEQTPLIENITEPSVELITETLPAAAEQIGKIKESEFDASMIKNRLIFPVGIFQEEPWIIENQPLPLWFVKEYGGDGTYIVSGVVAGPLKKEIGISGEEEFILPLAFQNPINHEFYTRNISFGTEEVIQATNRLGGYWAVSYLKNYKFIGGHETYTMEVAKFEDIAVNFQVGDQIAIGLDTVLVISPEDTEEEIMELINKDPDLKIAFDFLKSYWSSNKTIYEAMKENKDLPEIKFSPTYIFVEKIKKE